MSTPQSRSSSLRAHLQTLAPRRRRSGAWVDWDARGLGLGFEPDEVIAERVGRHPNAVKMARHRRGIPGYPWHQKAREEARRLFRGEVPEEPAPLMPAEARPIGQMGLGL